MTREVFLRNRLETASHNLYCCSANLLMTVPKEGYEAEYKEAAAEVEMLQTWLKEFHNTCPAMAVAAIRSAVAAIIKSNIPIRGDLSEEVADVIRTYRDGCRKGAVDEAVDVLSKLLPEKPIKHQMAIELLATQHELDYEESDETTFDKYVKTLSLIKDRAE